MSDIFDFFHIFQMPEEQAFSVLVKIMFDYRLRDFFRNEFYILHLHFYQLERLLQVWIWCLFFYGLCTNWKNTNFLIIITHNWKYYP